MTFPDSKYLPASLLLFALAAIAITIGASREIVISGHAVRLSAPLNYLVIVVGIGFLLIGIIAIRRSLKAEPRVLPIKNIYIDMLDFTDPNNRKRVRIRGRVSPPLSGIRVWILREHLAASPGKFHVGAHPALTDKIGEWQQLTNLWSTGRFRVHAIVVDPDSELLFRYYRQAFEEARRIYKRDVDPSALSFPHWPSLDSLPSRHLSAHSEIII